jgi:hypothetical protein
MEPPSFSSVEGILVRLLDGHYSREEADRWAVQWVYASDPPRMHPAIWRALSHIAGCDLRHGPRGAYLHSDEQIAEWLKELRSSDASAI